MTLDEARELYTNIIVELEAKGLQLPEGWRLTFDDVAVKRFGRCSYPRREIGLSTKLVLLNGPEAVGNTIRHEIAHSLTRGHGHDAVWRAMAIRCGSDGRRCYAPDADGIVVPAMPWIAQCERCGREFGRVRRPARLLCCICRGGFDARFALRYDLNPAFEASPRSRLKRHGRRPMKRV